jgi:LPXTG-motif cell wall-anchored protein
MMRVLRALLATTIALGGAVALSGAANAATCDGQTDGYGAGGVCGMTAEVQAVCSANVPTLNYSTTGATGATVTVTFVNPGGANVVYADRPLSGAVVWPGTVVSGGVVSDWPGWTKQSDGTWKAGDAYDWTLKNVQVIISDGTEASTVVSYPGVGCVPTTTVSHTEGSLAQTGANTGPLVGLAAAFLVVGTGVLLVSRRRRNV